MKEITIYCDGSSIGNPGPGGWGAIIIGGGAVQEIGGMEHETTNNRMELTAAWKALDVLADKVTVAIHTDSQYVIKGATQWVKGWEANGWQTKNKTDVLNKDLWQSLCAAARRHTVSWHHVRGHAGILLNERTDQIANGFAREGTFFLFTGSEPDYRTFLDTQPKARAIGSSSKSKKAYSYVSLRDGVVQTHATWAACEARVKGHKGVRFKKASSAEDEAHIIRAFTAHAP